MKPIRYIFFLTALLLSSVQAQRIRVQGNKLLVGENPIFMLGANTPWDKWNDFGHSFNATWWNTHFEQMHNSGINCTRIWISCNGDNTSPGIDASGKISQPTATFWSHVDQLFQIAQTNKIYLMIALISFDHTKIDSSKAPDYIPIAEKWRKMYNVAENRQSFVDNYAVPFVKRYKDNPYFWAIDVGNELDWVHENHSISISNVFDLVARVAIGIHANSEVLVTLGTGAGPKYLSPTYGTNYYSDKELQKLQPGAYLDFYDNHYYDWMKEWFSTPFEKGPSDWKIDEKPCVIGEYAALGHGSGFSPAECVEKAYNLGWQGLMPWTSNRVDNNGGISDFGQAFKTWADAHETLVFPPLEDAPGPFTLTITPPTGGLITVNPETAVYEKNSKITLIAKPAEGNELLQWSGDATGISDTVVLTITRNMTVSARFVSKGELITNGNFDNTTSGWTLGAYEGGAATMTSNTDKACSISITNGGTEQWHVQLLQAGLSLEVNKTYQLSFDISASTERSVFIAVGEAGGSYTKFLEKNLTVGTTTQKLSYEFTPAINVTNARVEFNIGLSTTGVTIDNVSLRRTGSSPVQATVNSSKPNALVKISVAGNSLQFHGIEHGMTFEGYTVNGKRIFSRTFSATETGATISFESNVSRLIVVKGFRNGNLHFVQKVVLRK